MNSLLLLLGSLFTTSFRPPHSSLVHPLYLSYLRAHSSSADTFLDKGDRHVLLKTTFHNSDNIINVMSRSQRACSTRVYHVTTYLGNVVVNVLACVIKTVVYEVKTDSHNFSLSRVCFLLSAILSLLNSSVNSSWRLFTTVFWYYKNHANTVTENMEDIMKGGKKCRYAGAIFLCNTFTALTSSLPS